MIKVFLGGTCNGSTWRDDLIKLLKVDYFNPVVEDWTPDCMTEEIIQRMSCHICLYVITPKITGVYSIAEVIDDSNKCPDKTAFIVLEEDGDKKFDKSQMRSLSAVSEMVARNGGTVFKDLKDFAMYANFLIK
jgi:hypothetical protein